MARASTGEDTATDTTLAAATDLLDGEPCEELVVHCLAASPEPISVHVDLVNSDQQIHGSTESYDLQEGETIPFAGDITNRINGLKIFSAAGTGTYVWTVTKA